MGTPGMSPGDPWAASCLGRLAVVVPWGLGGCRTRPEPVRGVPAPTSRRLTCVRSNSSLVSSSRILASCRLTSDLSTMDCSRNSSWLCSACSCGQAASAPAPPVPSPPCHPRGELRGPPGIVPAMLGGPTGQAAGFWVPPPPALLLTFSCSSCFSLLTSSSCAWRSFICARSRDACGTSRAVSGAGRGQALWGAGVPPHLGHRCLVLLHQLVHVLLVLLQATLHLVLLPLQPAQLLFQLGGKTAPPAVPPAPLHLAEPPGRGHPPWHAAGTPQKKKQSQQDEGVSPWGHVPTAARRTPKSLTAALALERSSI